MTQRGRPSAAALELMGIDPPEAATSLQKMPEAPRCLTIDQAAIWNLVISSRGGDLIAPEAFPVLEAYCKAVIAARQIDEWVTTFNPNDLADDEEVNRWGKIFAMSEKQNRLIATLASKLRLTPSSRIQPISAGRNAAKGAKSKPWETDSDED